MDDTKRACRPPAKLSDLIELAVADCRKLDQKRYEPSWESWHDGSGRNTCRICLAGGVIAGTLDVDPGKTVTLSDSDKTGDAPGLVAIHDQEWEYALYALDDTRSGNWENALEALDTRLDTDRLPDPVKRGIEGIPPPRHSDFENWDEFEQHLDSLEECAQQLRELGL